MNLKYISSFAIGPIISALLGLITIPFLTWFFSVEDIGRFTMVQIVLGLTVSLLSLAMHQSYVREYHEQLDKTVLLKTSMAPGIIAVIIVLLAIIITPYSLSEILFGIDSIALTVLLIVSVIATFFLNFFAHVIRMEERGFAFSLTQIMPKFTLLIFIGIIVLFGIPSKFLVLMLSNSISLLVTLLCFIILTFNSWKNILNVSIDIKLMKQMLKFSLPLVAGGLAYWGLTTIDRFFLRAYSGFIELGLYSVSVTIVNAVSVVTAIFASIWHPTVYKWAKEGIDTRKIQNVIQYMTLAFSIIWSSAGLLSWIIPLFLPSEYRDIPFLIVSCISMPLFYLLSETTGVGVGISRKSIYGMYASIAAVILNTVLNYFLVPRYGAAGASLATCYSFFIFFLVRTEASSYAWFSLPRGKLYSVTSLYVLLTTALFFYQDYFNEIHYIFYILWVALIILSLILHRKIIIVAFNHIKFLLRGD